MAQTFVVLASLKHIWLCCRIGACLVARIFRSCTEPQLGPHRQGTTRHQKRFYHDCLQSTLCCFEVERRQQQCISTLLLIPGICSCLESNCVLFPLNVSVQLRASNHLLSIRLRSSTKTWSQNWSWNRLNSCD